MSGNPGPTTPGVYRIASLSQGALSPVGVNLTLPAFQNVYVNAPVQAWTITKASDTTYQLSVAGYGFTGVVGTNVVASINFEQNEEWQFTYSETQGAYTITRATQPGYGWTIPSSLANGSNVSIKPITTPQFVPTQLFVFEPIDE